MLSNACSSSFGGQSLEFAIFIIYLKQRCLKNKVGCGLVPTVRHSLMSTQRVGSVLWMTNPELQEHLRENESDKQCWKTSYTFFNVNTSQEGLLSV